jgi:predicted KAP-like P-loop ATPase
MNQWLDDPVEDEGQDELARGPFAALIAAALLAENKRRATVVGITGGWGTGKTTVANFVIKRVQGKATVVRFEPWMVGTSEALAREFFKELGKAAWPKEDTKDAREARARYYRYAA